MKYTLTVTQEEYDFIVAAITTYAHFVCEESDRIKQKVADQASTWMIKQETEKMIATTKAAPWGLKKDGTPKKQPGRKVSS